MSRSATSPSMSSWTTWPRHSPRPSRSAARRRCRPSRSRPAPSPGSPTRTATRSGCGSRSDPPPETVMAADCLATVIVINRNGRHFLADCLSALDRQSVPRWRFEVLFVDNASTDGSAAFVRDQFPHVRLIDAGGNLGFTGANNLGIRLAHGRHVILLNNDTRVDPGWLAGLLAAAEGERVGGVVSRLLFRDDPGRVNSTGLVPYRDGRGGDRDLFCPAAEANPPLEEVFGGCGASLLLTRGLLDDMGGLDPALFIYYEDFDIAWRGRL